MEVDEKLNETSYFLNLLQQNPQDRDHAKEFMYVLSAFLNAWRSVLDVLLYDYAEIFSLGLSREERINDRDFEVAARALNNSQAQSFIQWWKQQLSILGQNPLWLKRKVIVHRGYPPTMHHYTVIVSDSIAVSSTISVMQAQQPTQGTSVNPNALSPSNSTIQTQEESNSTNAAETGAEIRFADLQDRSIVDYCEQALDQMVAIVNPAKSQFGTTP